jgi:hypothetical protein
MIRITAFERELTILLPETERLLRAAISPCIHV